jgi:hypothetical protein
MQIALTKYRNEPLLLTARGRHLCLLPGEFNQKLVATTVRLSRRHSVGAKTLEDQTNIHPRLTSYLALVTHHTPFLSHSEIILINLVAIASPDNTLRLYQNTDRLNVTDFYSLKTKFSLDSRHF